MKPVLTFLCLGLFTGTLCAADRPNIVVILSDDYGYGHATVTVQIQPLVKTPGTARRPARFRGGVGKSKFPAVDVHPCGAAPPVLPPNRPPRPPDEMAAREGVFLTLSVIPPNDQTNSSA